MATKTISKNCNKHNNASAADICALSMGKQRQIQLYTMLMVDCKSASANKLAKKSWLTTKGEKKTLGEAFEFHLSLGINTGGMTKRNTLIYK